MDHLKHIKGKFVIGLENKNLINIMLLALSSTIITGAVDSTCQKCPVPKYKR